MRFVTDTGGISSDLIIEDKGKLHLFKSPTTPDNPVERVLGAFPGAAAAFSANPKRLLASGVQSRQGGEQ